MDTRTEVQLQQALLRLLEGRTAFVIAHRLSTIRNADEVLVVNDHRIIERGSHEELLAMKGFYHDLYTSQYMRVKGVQPVPERSGSGLSRISGDAVPAFIVKEVKA